MEITNDMQSEHAHEVAGKYETQIKGAITEKYLVPPTELTVLMDDENGVYVSEKEPNTLCSLVTGDENGLLYVVSAKMQANGDELSDFKADIVA